MKQCPFCREEIRDEATKCRFCLSSLSSKPEPQQATATQITGQHKVIYSVDRDLIRSAKVAIMIVAFFLVIGILLYLDGFGFKQGGPGPDQTIYVVDRGLLRFVKFAGAVLGVFVTVGIFLYGFNLKELAKEIRETADSMEDLHRQATSTNEEIRRSKEAVAADRAESENLLKLTRESLASTQLEQKKIIEAVDENRQRLELLLTQGATSIAALEQQFQSRVEQLTISRQLKTAGKKHPVPTPRHFTVPELARIYDFPNELDGSGQCIALIELGGGYKQSDLKTYFNDLGIPMPKVTWESFGGAKNHPTGPQGPDTQVMLNIEVAGAVAPGAHIVVYFAPNTSEGFLGAIETAIADEVNRPSIISISWGGPETSWTPEIMTKFDLAFKTAAGRGITVVCAAGDNGVTDGVIDGKAHVDFPASSPWVLACGGTRLTVSASKVVSEVVWNDGTSGTGGGISSVFPLPDWQSRANVPTGEDGHQGRGIPDVAANASPETGYSIYAHGHSIVVGGTAAATPLWSGLIALLNQGLGRNIGNINSELYSDIGPAGVLRGITEGNNSVNDIKGYTAGPGWNACAGWGTPNGTKLLQALRSLPAATAL